MHPKQRMSARGGDGGRTGVHNKGIVRTGGTGRLPLIGSAFLMTGRRSWCGRKAMLECTSRCALSITDEQGRGKQHHYLIHPTHLFTS